MSSRVAKPRPARSPCTAYSAFNSTCRTRTSTRRASSRPRTKASRSACALRSDAIVRIGRGEQLGMNARREDLERLDEPRSRTIEVRVAIGDVDPGGRHRCGDLRHEIALLERAFDREAAWLDDDHVRSELGELCAIDRQCRRTDNRTERD